MRKKPVRGKSIVAFAASVTALWVFCAPFAHAQEEIARQKAEGETGLEIVAEFARRNPPGNIAVTPDGRLIVSQHQFFGSQYRVVEVLPDGSTRPFPNDRWASPLGEDGIGLYNVLGLRCDREGILWILDRSPGDGRPGRLVGWDTRSNELHRIVYLASPVIPENAFLNDLAVDRYNDAIYIADTAGGDNSALIVVDLKTGYARRVLEGDTSVRPEDVSMVIDGKTVTLQGAEARVGVNPIAIDPNNEWVYYGAMSGTAIYRVRTKVLRDRTLSPAELSARVERYGDKPLSDGITIDGAGNVYVTDITDNAIGVVEPSGTYRILYQDDELLSWPDGFGFGPNNTIYVTVNQLHRSAVLNGGEDIAEPPFYILRFPALEAGVVGR